MTIIVRSLARTLMVGLLSFGLSFNVFATSAFAQHGELRSTSLFEPDSPLFALQHVLDAWEEFLAFDPLDKASVHAKLADNRLAEVAAMIHKDRPDIAAQMAAQMAELAEKASARLVEAKAAADRDGAGAGQGAGAGKQAAIAKVLERLQANVERQQSTLKTLLEKTLADKSDKAAIEKLKSAIDNAMERSASGLENAIRRVSGERGPVAPTARPAATPTAPATGQPEATPARPAATPAAPTTPARPAATPTAPATGQPEATPARPAATPTAPTAPTTTAVPAATPVAPTTTAVPAATPQPTGTP